MATKRLRVATEADAPKKPPATIKAAVDTDERALLVALRAKAAAEIDKGVPAHTLPGLMKHLRELDKEIRAIDARAGDDDESEGHAEGERTAPFNSSAI